MISSTDVAKRAGVSQATVSRVLNNPDSVKPATRQKVLQAMEELQYRPNLIARSLVTQHTKTIALVSGSLKNGIFVETLDSMVNVATKKGYKTTVFFEGDTDWREILDAIQGYRVDGILISTLKLDDPFADAIEAAGIPCMQLNRKTRKAINFVALDNILAGKMITNHLLDLGHKRIAHISGSLNVSTFHDRKVGIDQALEEGGIPFTPELHFVIEPTAHEVEKVTWKLMKLGEPPTAILCSSDAMALVVMDALMSMGYEIPRDVSLAGIDNIGISSHQAIQLTTIGNPKFSLGEIAVESLVDIISGTLTSPQQHVLVPELIVRKTTGKLKITSR